MQLRFLAVAGPRGELERYARRHLRPGTQSFVRIVDAPELVVWTPREVPTVPAAGDIAVAVGLVFERDSGRVLDTLPSPLPTASEFVRGFWGSYVLIGTDGADHFVLRDPSGALTAYHRRIGGLDVYASDIELLVSAQGDPLEPDLAFLAEWLAYPYLRGGTTGARGVTEIVAGEARIRQGERTRFELAWHPRRFPAARRTIRDFDAAAKTVRDAILFAVPRVAGEARDIVVHLSGGLDSSAVAGALASAGLPFRAVTYATRAVDGDERVYARMVANHCGIELAELLEQPGDPDFEEVPPRALRPLPNALLRPLHRAFDNFLLLTGADLAVDGTGGDNVFCYLATAAPALDAFRALAWPDGVRALDGLAQVHETTAWRIAKAGWRNRGAPRSVWDANESFLVAGVAPSAPRHPWLGKPRARLRGTHEQIQSIVGIRHFIRDSASAIPAVLHPLLSQPVLEACLRIPSWLWVRGGRDRSVARAALKGLLPDAILARRAKGRLESMALSGYMARRNQLESLLVDGKLAQAGLLDAVAVRAYLHRAEQPEDSGYIRLLDLASAETWLRSFEP